MNNRSQSFLFYFLFLALFSSCITKNDAIDVQGIPGGIDESLIPAPKIKVTIEKTDSDNDGIFESLTRQTGNIGDDTISVEYDENGDGVYESKTVSHYDDFDRVTQKIVTDLVNGLVIQTAYAYNDLGHLISKKSDTDGDGVYDEVQLHVYDEGNSLTQIGLDTDFDSNIDITEVSIQNFYDDIHLIKSIREENFVEGVALTVTTSEYDFLQRETSKTVDFAGDDESAASLTIIERVYDEWGNATLVSSDLNGDGTFDDVRIYNFGSDGARLYQVEVDTNFDGEGDGVVEYNAYNLDGDLLREMTFDTVDGSLLQETSYQYDRYGNLLQKSTDLAGDGTIDQVIMVEYEFFDQ